MSFIASPAKFLNTYAFDPDVLVSTIPSHLANHKFKIIDFCVRGGDRELTYAFSPDLHLNVRSACTVIQTEDQILWGRKSLPYAFEYKLEYLGQSFEKERRAILDALFGRVRQTIGRNNKVEIVKTELIDGVNVEVTFIPEINAWNIASCNCSIAVTGRKDINQYLHEFKSDNPIFQVTQQWFNQIQRLKNGELKELKSLLTDHTLVGNLVTTNYIINHRKEKNRPFVWNARINHFSNAVCLDIFETRKLLNRLGFDFVRTKSMGIVASYDNFLEFIQEIARSTFQSPLNSKESGSMGSIIYFIQHRQKGNNIQMQVIGNTNTLTLQYQIYDHINYLLKGVCSNIDDEDVREESVEELENQWMDKISVYKCFPEFPLQHYSYILQQGIRVINELGLRREVIANNFNQFISALLYCLRKNIELRPEMINCRIFQQFSKGIQFSDFGVFGCKHITVYVPLGIPGIGKSYLGRTLLKEIQKIGHKALIVRSADITDDDTLHDQISLLLQQESAKDKYYIYLDSDMSFKQLQSTMSKIQHSSAFNHYYQYIHLNPCHDRFTSKDDEYPFSLNTILLSLKNVVKKKDFQYFCHTLSLIRSYKNVTIKEEIRKCGEYEYELLGCRVRGEQGYLRERIESLLTQLKTKEETYEEIVSMLENVEVRYPSQQGIQNQVQEILRAGMKPLPTVQLASYTQ